MFGLPLHPAIVHIPLGLALVIPFVAVGLAWAVWRKKAPAGVFAVVVLMQAVVVGSGFAAIQLGKEDEEVVESVVPEEAIHEHEEAAELFEIVSGVTLAIGIAALALGRARPGAASGLMAATALAGVVAAGLGVRAGHEGGKLVYEHQAARAFAPSDEPAAVAAHASHDDDDDD